MELSLSLNGSVTCYDVRRYDVEDRGRGRWRWRLSVADREPLSGSVNTLNTLRDSLTKNCDWKRNTH